jgi:hypothetical protein
MAAPSHSSFGPFYCEGREVLRRIFVTVRDRHWQEIRPTYWESSTDGCVTARHQSPDIDFEWRGTFKASDDARCLQFSFEGLARREMDICRLGLIVLHPVESMLGSRITARGPQGSETLIVAERIHPQPIINGTPGAITEPFSELLIEREDLGRLCLRLAGDLFELEDQRNWGDASFKTYCTPLRLGFPRHVKAGSKIAHRVEVEFEPGVACGTAMPRAPAQGRFPAIGSEWPERVGSFHHVDLTGHDPLNKLATCLTQSIQRLQVAVNADCAPGVRDELVRIFAPHRSRIARILAYGTAVAPPSTRALSQWSQRLQGTPMCAATRGYFVEFNRAAAPEEAASGIAFPLTATVHCDDSLTIAENVATIRDIAQTAHPPIAIAPLALYHPARETGFPQELVLPWLTATLIHAALAKVTSITLGADLLTAIGGLEAMSALRWLVGCAGAEVTELPEPLPTGVHAAAVCSRGCATAELVAANLTPRPVRIPFGPSELTIPAFGVFTPQ